MKKIEAVIRLSQFDKIRDALAGIGVRFFTLKEVKGFGLQKGQILWTQNSCIIRFRLSQQNIITHGEFGKRKRIDHFGLSHSRGEENIIWLQIPMKRPNPIQTLNMLCDII